VISFQRWNASSRHSSIHSGSFFLPEMKRTMSSFSPFAARSVSMSVTKPYLYFSPARSATRSVVSRKAITVLLCRDRRAPCHQAAPASDSRIHIVILARPAEAHADTAARECLVDTHRGEHMRSLDLARRARGARRHCDAIEIERDQ